MQGGPVQDRAAQDRTAQDRTAQDGAAQEAERRVAEQVGTAVRARRRSLGLTLEAVGRRTGLSKSFLSQVESGRTNPTLGTLTRLSLALGATPAALFGGPAPSAAGDGAADAAPPVTTLRPARPKANWPAGTGRTYPLTAPGAHRFEVVLCDGTPRHHERAVRHAGAEFCHVLAGAVRVEVGSQSRLLHAGESLHYDGGVPHRIAAQTGTTRFLLVI
ncbi:XRE family transcriptional regulator [Streptacidiphilus sp. ASG 303]|uniref:helix-turn-helix domain-containing protein n=1 Tax=Streptacidiphilus sp. ASG 303 TaxID=2896847 RepID=UPI001E645F41|nr:XRE family transcriptional regulator [Streptacidiphilus sp. ASG 303]MCD0484396.1 XRE family transcriptional regulator [Streptacidiphilus sp. ASG 303]